MNIGLFTETYYPEINGVANSVYLLKEELERRGNQVYVFTTTSPGAPEYEHNVFRVPSLPCMLITERRVGLFYSPRLASVIKKLNLDVIHTHTEFSLGLFGRIMAKELRLPIVHTYHTIYEDYTHYVNKVHIKSIDERARAFMRMFTKVCCNTVERVVVPTDKVRKLLEGYHVVKDIEVIPTGIDLGKFQPERYAGEEIIALRSSLGIKPADRVILYLGRLSEEKNIEQILSMMPDYMRQHEDTWMVIVGDGPEKEKLMKNAGAFWEKGRILFTGAKPWDEIGRYYRIGDVFVSASNSETQGLTFLEAMASGLPVVAKKDPCLADILMEGENGCFFETKEEFLQALDLVLYDGRKEQMARAARAVAAKYSTEEFAAGMERLYVDLIRSNIQRSALPIS